MPVEVPTQEEINTIYQRLEALESVQPVTYNGSTGPMIWHKNSGDNSEQVISIPLGYPTGTQSRIIFTIPLPTLYPGDLVEMHGSYEVTNPYNYNALSGRYLAINNQPGTTIDINSYVSESAVRNVTPNMHHDVVQDFGTFEVVEEMEGKHAVMIGYGGASRASLSHRFTVEQDYGRLYVKVFRAGILE